MDDIFPIVSAGNPSSRMDLTSPALISGLRSQGWQYLGQSYGSAHLHENYGQIWLILRNCSGQLKLQLTHLTRGSLNMMFSINIEHVNNQHIQ
jgi:hypothetical protein